MNSGTFYLLKDNIEIFILYKVLMNSDNIWMLKFLQDFNFIEGR